MKSKSKKYSSITASNLSKYSTSDLFEIAQIYGVEVIGRSSSGGCSNPNCATCAAARVRRSFRSQAFRDDLLVKIRNKMLEEEQMRKRLQVSRSYMKNFSKKRLMRDYKEIVSNPLPTVCAHPLKNNIYEWHGNLLAPSSSKYHGICLHLVMRFSEDYPYTPPKVEIQTQLSHSHVMSGWGDVKKYGICLDLLETHQSTERYSGWSTCYSVLTILLQLQSFLLEEEDMQSRSSIERDIRESLQFKCKGCGHDIYSSPSPFPKNWNLREFFETNKHVRRNQAKKMVMKLRRSEKKNRRKVKKTGVNPERVARLADMCFIPEILREIFSYLLQPELMSVGLVSRSFSAMAFDSFFWEQRELKCFYSKRSFVEDVIGIGFNVKYSRSTGKILNVAPILDLVGYESFSGGSNVRNGVWNETFARFLPLYLTNQHWKRALPIFEKLVVDLYQLREYDPIYAADLMCKFMNSLVVIIMTGELYASERALQGYSYFHRILIYYVMKYPRILKQMNYITRLFATEEEVHRHKYQVCSIGEFFPIIGCSRYTWNYIKEAMVDETFQRNSMWVERKTGINLMYVGRKTMQSKQFQDKIFESQKVSKSLLMFQVSFLKGLPTKPNKKDKDLELMAEMYDQRCGSSPDVMRKLLQDAIFKIQKIDNFKEFFEFVGVQNKGSRKECAMFLSNSCEKGWKRGYFENLSTPHTILSKDFKRVPKKEFKRSVPRRDEETFRPPAFRRRQERPRVQRYRETNGKKISKKNRREQWRSRNLTVASSHPAPSSRKYKKSRGQRKGSKY